jgi:hypothetical protein
MTAADADSHEPPPPPPFIGRVLCPPPSPGPPPATELEDVAPLPLRRGGAPPPLSRISRARRRASLHLPHHTRQSSLCS